MNQPLPEPAPSSDQTLLALFIPALCTLLLSAEDAKDSPLTEQEVLALRDEASVIMVSKAHAEAMHESRGYTDIDPENCWYDWQMLRRESGRKPDLDPGARFAYVSKDDTNFQATIADAQASLQQFRNMLDASRSQRIFPLVKVLLEEAEARAYIWLRVVSSDGHGFVGEIFELPSAFREFSIDMQIPVPDSAVKDWMINDEGTLYGGYSLRYSRANMSDTEKLAFDAHVGIKVYA